ncbi:MAG: helix-turn-helix domain-containing protein [Deltaproteobacteria bacterium]|nr:helix-turn-helix domain-containing protein [Deltaproteobacteria bacterium]
MRHLPIEVGSKIREIRKKTSLSMKELSEKIGVSLLTLQRIETGKVSPSVVLLSEIAYQLHYPLHSFLTEERSVILLKGKAQPFIKSHKLKLKVLAHRGALDDNISITLGEAKKGEFISKHKNRGYELTYIIKGKNIFNYGNKKYELSAGDVIYHEGKDWHSVFAIEPTEFLNIHFLKK